MDLNRIDINVRLHKGNPLKGYSLILQSTSIKGKLFRNVGNVIPSAQETTCQIKLSESNKILN